MRIYGYNNYIHGVDIHTPSSIAIDEIYDKFPWDIGFTPSSIVTKIIKLLPDKGVGVYGILNTGNISPPIIYNSDKIINYITAKINIDETGAVYRNNNMISLPTGRTALESSTYNGITITILDDFTLHYNISYGSTLLKPTDVNIPHDIKPTHISCGENHFVILSNGEIFVYGTNIITGSTNSSMVLNKPILNNCIDIYTDKYFNVVLNNEGNIAYWGSITKLSDGSQHILNTPKEVYLGYIDGTRMVKCNKYGLILYISKNNNVIKYICDDINKAKYETYDIIAKIPTIPDNETIVDIAVGDFTACVTTSSGSMYAWGKPGLPINTPISDIPKSSVSVLNNKFILLYNNEAYSTNMDKTKLFKIPNATLSDYDKYGMPYYKFISDLIKKVDSGALPELVDISTILDNELASLKKGEY